MKKTRTRLALSLILSTLLLSTSFAERPDVTHFFPDWTVALFHIPDTVEFAEEARSSGFARMLQDEEVKPFVENLYGSAASLVQEVELRLGMTLEQLLQIPSGEFAVAVVAPPALTPELVVLMDVDSENRDVDALIDEGEFALEQAGYAIEEQTEGNTKLKIFTNPNKNDGPKQLVRFRRDDALIITTSTRVAKRLIDNLDGGDKENLMDNQAFAAIKTRCESDGRSSLFWFVDPIRLIRSATKGNVGAQAGLAVLPALGLDGLKGLGGNAVSPKDNEVESISHMHIYMENPRNGVLEMITLKTGDSQPEEWVPKDLINYITMHLDIQNSYSILKDLYDGFRTEGAWGEMIKRNISDNLGIDFEQEFIAELQGRITILQWYERPPRINAQATLVGLKLFRPDRFRSGWDTVVEKFEDNFEADEVTGYEIYTIKPRGNLEIEIDADGDEDDSPRARRRRLRQQRQPRPSFALIDDYFVMADRPSFIKKIIETKQSGDGLANDENFQKVAALLKRQPTGNGVSSLTYSQPKESLEMFYELLRSDEARKFLESQREDNPVLAALHDAMEDHPLPPFSRLEKYMAPSGAMITNEETGIHIMGISLRHQALAEEIEQNSQFGK